MPFKVRGSSCTSCLHFAMCMSAKRYFAICHLKALHKQSSSSVSCMIHHQCEAVNGLLHVEVQASSRGHVPPCLNVRDSVLMHLSSLMAILKWLPCFYMCCWLDLALCLQGVAWVGGTGSSDLESVLEHMRSNSEAIQLCTFYYIVDAYEV